MVRHARQRRARLAGWLLAFLALAACDESEPFSPNPILITTPSDLPAATVGVEYDQTLTAAGGDPPLTWSVVSGSLPSGLTLSVSGRITGRPTNRETRSFGVSAADGGQAARTDLTLVVDYPPLAITTASLAAATLGSSYTQFLEAVGGGTAPVMWTRAGGVLPPGIALSTAGILTGNASALGRFDFTVRAAREGKEAERSFFIQVEPQPLAITTTSLPPAKVGTTYLATLESSGGVGGNSWRVTTGRVPTGLSLEAGGTIGGTPVSAETATFTVEVSSGAQRAARSLSLTVDPPGFPSALTVDTPGNVFVPFLAQITVGGTITWRFGSVPHNVIFVPAPGVPADINIVTNVDVSRRFDVVGDFTYDCTVHPGMRGRVEVKPAA